MRRPRFTWASYTSEKSNQLKKEYDDNYYIQYDFGLQL